jgi:glc operon protein GlcG
MEMFSLVSRALASVCLLLMSAGPGSEQAPSPAPTVVPSLISLAEARVIIDAATTFARDQKMVMAVAVVDRAGNVVSGDRMDGSSFGNTHLAEGKAFASLVFRQTTEVLAGLAKDGDAIRALGEHFGITLDPDRCYPYRRS